jgi:replicative DNA helicase
MRVPAQLVEIEESILAACLLFPKMRDEALDILSHADFYKPNHGKIFKAICDLTQKHEVADLLTVSAALSGQIDSVMSMIAEISNNPVPTDMASYCHKIVNCRQLRDAQAILSRAFDRCFDPKADFSALMDEATSGLSDIDMGTLGSSFLTMSELTQRSAERYSCLKNGEDMPGIRTGFRTIDRLTGGFRNSQLIIIAGRPGTGKTAFACNLLAHMASAGNQCGFFSLEMSADELDDRWNAAEARVNSAVLKFGGRIDDSTWAKLIDAFERKSKWPVLVDDTPASISELKRRAKLMKRSGAKIIFHRSTITH